MPVEWEQIIHGQICIEIENHYHDNTLKARLLEPTQKWKNDPKVAASSAAWTPYGVSEQRQCLRHVVVQP